MNVPGRIRITFLGNDASATPWATKFKDCRKLGNIDT